jgi:two-component system NtrC family sensor kinase
MAFSASPNNTAESVHDSASGGVNPALAPAYHDVESDRSLLIVDDDKSVCSLFALCLCEKYTCATAANYDEAMVHLAQRPFALVVTDLIMPGRGGIELLREVTSRYPDTAVVIVSGVDRSQRVIDALRLGAFDYLIKPVDLDVLELSVERALERRMLLRSAKQYKLDLERRNAELRESKSKLERLQAQIVQTEKMASLGQLAAGVAHELNNPAGYIFGNMEILQGCASGIQRLLDLYEDQSLTGEQRAMIEKLKEEIDYENTITELSSMISDCREGAERIRDVVQNLRIFSRLDEADYKKIDIHEGLESTIRFLSRYYSSGAIVLRRNYSDIPQVDCYAGQLNQVWMNLLANAAHAVRDGGEVNIFTELKEESVLVTIADTGCGISPEHLSRIFDPFFTTKPVGEGTGLGLSVTYGIIERHGGSIQVASTLGAGTSFKVTLPVSAVAIADRAE